MSAPRRISNPPNPWRSDYVEWLDAPPLVALEVYEEEAKSIIAHNDSPDVGFDWSVNPYRGCQHACAYCYARPTHQFLGFGAGTDFDSRIVVKRNAAELMPRELAHRRWKQGRRTIAFSGVTDCYQPLEASYQLTRSCLELCDQFSHPVAIITKSALVRRDAELLARMSRRGGAHVTVSIPFASDEDARKIEPLASAPSTRLETIRRLAEAGVPVGVGIAPVIPGLTDSAIAEILQRARDAGARDAFMVLLRLPGEVLPVFEERMREAFPERFKKVFGAIRETRGGRLNLAEFGGRMRGAGARWEAIRQLFDAQCRRLGLEHRRLDRAENVSPPVVTPVQIPLFGSPPPVPQSRSGKKIPAPRSR
jgi:DNA repair photolyase